MVGDGVDGVVWEAASGEMMFEPEEELAVIPFAFKSAFISPSVFLISLISFIFSS
jgi:hypothetical protein